MERSEEELISAVNNSDDTARYRKIRLANAVEISVGLAFLGVALGGAAIGNLIMYRTCVHSLHHPVEECRSFLAPEAINHTQELEKEVQEYATFVGTVKSVLEALGPAILSLFVGGWSDKHGRKPLLVWPMLGMTLSSMLTVVYSMLDGFGPWWITPTVIPFTLSGGYCAILIGIMCYVSDVTSPNNKALSFLIIQATITLSSALGGLASSYLLKAVGTVYLLLIQATLFTIAYAFTNVFIEESMKDAEPGTLLTVFDLSHAKEMVRACLREKPNKGRAILLLTVGASTLSIFTIYGSTGLIYMYTRTKLGWTMKDFTTFSSVSTAMWFAGSFFGIAVLRRFLRISDLNFIAISFASCFIEYTIKSFATEKWHMYLGSMISLFGTISAPLIRTFLTKTVPEDIAKVFGLMGCTESIVPLFAPVIYNALYAATVFKFPAAALMLTSAINVICLVLIWIAQYLVRRESSVGYQSIGSEES